GNSIEADEAISLTLGGIVNPEAAGPTDTFSIQTPGDQGTAPAVTIIPGAHHNNLVVANGGNPVTAGQAFEIVITLRDQFNNPRDFNGPGAVQVTSDDASIAPDETVPTLPGLIQDLQFADGVATVPGIILVNASETPTISVYANPVTGT